MSARIYYDGNCPFCSRYVQLLRLRDTVGEVHLVNLRQHESKRLELQAAGFNVDQGMVLDLDGQLYGGDAAVHQLALLTTGSDAFNRISRKLLQSRLGARLLYPWLRLGRAATLVALDRAPFHVDSEGERAQRLLFCMAWALFAYLHVVIYAFDYYAPMYPTTWLMGLVAVCLFLFPLSRRLFILLLTLMIGDAVLQAPSHSNHTILANTLIAALLASGVWHSLRGDRWHHFFSDAAPIGRAALACMYVFGVFHKINTGFLDPSVSCALALWREMPVWLSWIGFPGFDEIAIYGTLVVESAILGCLLVPAGRRFGIALGMCFHALLALSGYSMYAPFSTLTIALHLLFLDPDSARRIVSSSFWQRTMAKLHGGPGLAAFGLWLVAVVVLAWNRSFSSLGLLWLPIIGVLCYTIFRYGHAPAGHSRNLLLWSRLWWLNGLSILFFIGCFSPYLGLRTAQAMNMFANLRLEGGISNHLVFRNAPGPFDYLEDVVEIVDVDNSQQLAASKHYGLKLVYYDLLDQLDHDPSIRVSFMRHGRLNRDQTAKTLGPDIERILHPRWFRLLFHFNPVDTTAPKPCSPSQ